MSSVASFGFSHIRLTVSNIERSARFYDAVFGWPRVIDFADASAKPGFVPGPANFYGGVMFMSDQGVGLGLRPVGHGAFDPDVVGLDHLSFAVTSRAELERAYAALESEGIPHGEIKDLSGGITILSFEDPDGIALELTAPTAPST